MLLSSPPLLLSILSTHKPQKEHMEEMSYLWSHQESDDELKLKIHYTALELEAVKAKANEEMTKNAESLKQLLHLLKLVCQERDEARDQIQKLLNKIMPSINNPMIRDRYIDQVHPHHHYSIIKPAKANSSFAESTCLSDAYNHCSSLVDSPFDLVTSPDRFSNINTNSTSTTFVQDYQMLPQGFDVAHGPLETNHVNLMMESMIKGKVLPQKGSLLKAVIEAGPLLQTLFATKPPPIWGKLSPPRFLGNIGGQNQVTLMTKQSQQLSKMSYGCFSQMVGGMSSMASNFGPVEKRQRFC